MGVTPRSVLLSQIEVSAANLGRGRAVLRDQPLHDLLPSVVRERLEGRMRQQELALRELGGRVPAGSPHEGLWDEFEAIQLSAEASLNEALAFAGGTLIREAAVDRGMCDLADALLGEFNRLTDRRWEGITMIAPAESFRRRTHVVGVRFPEFSVWALPLAAHEFGHLLAQEAREQLEGGNYEYPIAQDLDGAGAELAHQRELFADVFATYALGPAYACTAILLRFSPTAAAHPDVAAEHPGDGKRVFAILRTLRWLSLRADARTQPFRGVAETLEQTWRDLVAARPGDASVHAVDEEALGYWVDDVFVPQLERLAGRARCSGWGRAVAVGKGLANGRGGVPGEPDLRELLNGAWRARLKAWGSPKKVNRLSERALEECVRAAGRPIEETSDHAP